MHQLLEAIGILLSFGGVFLSLFIYQRKRRKKAFVCPFLSDCKEVTKSSYSKLLGIPIEFLGVLFYSVSFLLYLYILAVSENVDIAYTGLLIWVSLGFLFTAYLTFIQITVLKRACTWCLMSGVLVATIFAITIDLTSDSIVILMKEYKLLMVILHLVGVALGVGGATITDLLFFKFLKDLRISKWEAQTLHYVSQIIWVGLGLLILSGVGLFLSDMAGYMQSGKFLAKMLIVAVLTVNGIVLNLFITPKLVHITFGQKHKHKKGELHHLRKLAFALGAVSFTSWYTALILGAVPGSLGLQLIPTVLTYLGILSMAIIGSQILEKNIRLLKH